MLRFAPFYWGHAKSRQCVERLALDRKAAKRGYPPQCDLLRQDRGQYSVDGFEHELCAAAVFDESSGWSPDAEGGSAAGGRALGDGDVSVLVGGDGRNVDAGGDGDGRHGEVTLLDLDGFGRLIGAHEEE